MNSTVFEMIIRVFGAFLSIYSFAVLLQVPRRFVLQAGIVGAIGGFVYLLAIHFGRGDVMASLYSAVAAAVVSHIFARVYKTPVTLFLIAGVLPTVPGKTDSADHQQCTSGKETSGIRRWKKCS